MKITYIHHSAFLVETESACLLFDWFEGKLPLIPREKQLYVLASHVHGDHFSKEIFSLAKEHPKITYILSWDIPENFVPGELKSSTRFLQPNEIWQDDVLTVETFRSTDEGVAFWCSVDGKQLYHAGDLNHWYWEGEEEQWNREMTATYRGEIVRMAGRVADAAFLPVDPRLGDWFWLGADDYMGQADAKVIFPMHFWENFGVCQMLRNHRCSEKYRDRIAVIEKTGQTFVIETEREEIPMTFKFAHNNINVKNLDVSLAFYREALGLEETKRIAPKDGSFIIVYLGDGQTPHLLELTWLRDWEKDHYDLGDNEFHLAFRTDDFEAAHAKHAQMGCICFENPAMGIYFINDPDNYWLEILP